MGELFWIPVLAVVLGPLALVRRGYPRVAMGLAFGPAALLGLAAVIASHTAWGHREVPNDYTDHTWELGFSCAVFVLAGLVGVLVMVLGDWRARWARTDSNRRP